MIKTLACIILLPLSLISGCSSQPYVIKLAEDAPRTGHNEIYVVSHGWHTGLVLPAKEIQLRLPGLKKRFGDKPFIEFGWGDKGFYQTNEITTGLTFRAMFWSSGSVIHAVAVPGDVLKFFQNSEVRQLCLSDAGVSSLIDFIANSFSKNPQGEIVELKNGIYGDSQFYAGTGDYYLFNTCNKWTAKALRSAGMDISPTFKLTAGSVMSYVHGQTNTCSELLIKSGAPEFAPYSTFGSKTASARPEIDAK
jgi:uncharacterized protein (TIGR02117 family)